MDDLVYFLHVPKTAGTSVHGYLKHAVGPRHVSPPMLWDHLVDQGPHRIPDRWRVIMGHFGGLLPLWLGRWPRIITMLREPAARALSHINHVGRDRLHPLHRLAADVDIVGYCEHPRLRKTIDNLQSRYLASLSFSTALVPKTDGGETATAPGSVSVSFEDALLSLDQGANLEESALAALDQTEFVGICEAFDASLEAMSKVLGWRSPRPGTTIRLNEAPSDQTAFGRLTSDEVDALERCNRVDRVVYEAARLRLAETCRALGVELPESM